MRCPLSRTMIRTGIIIKLLLEYCPNSRFSTIMPGGLPRTGSTKLAVPSCYLPIVQMQIRLVSPLKRGSRSAAFIRPPKCCCKFYAKKDLTRYFPSEYCAVWIFSVTALILWSSAVWQIVSESNDWFSNNTDWPTESGICWLLYLVEIMKVHFPYFEVELDFH